LNHSPVFGQHSQFEAIEAKLRRQEPLFFDVKGSSAANVSPLNGDTIMPAITGSYGLDFDDRYDDGIDPSSQTKNFKVVW
jgi:hypothetical protein